MATVGLDSCLVRDQQGFICESNAIEAQDMCLDTDQKVCHFEVRSNIDSKTLLVYVGKGCACLRTTCDYILVDNIKVNTTSYSNLCICNFTHIIGCDFHYLAPVTSYHLIKTNYTLYQELIPTPIGMDLTRTQELLQHQNLIQILDGIRNNGQKTLITVHHDAEQITKILERVKKDGDHKWWEVLFGWSPTATGLINKLLHPIVILFVLTLLGFVFCIGLYIMTWRMFKRQQRMMSVFQMRQNMELGRLWNEFRDNSKRIY